MYSEFLRNQILRIFPIFIVNLFIRTHTRVQRLFLRRTIFTNFGCLMLNYVSICVYFIQPFYFFRRASFVYLCLFAVQFFSDIKLRVKTKF